jgi:UDPglucose 6-dehydrogenase/GDP-mannose 6-dehydrogenase
MNITIIGTGYVGLVSGVCLASKQHNVTCVDIREEVVDLLNNNKPHIHENGLSELLDQTLKSGHFKATTDLNNALEQSELVIIAVGTPSKNGKINLTQIKNACTSIGNFIKTNDKFISVVVKSTVVPGTTDTFVKDIIESTSGKKLGEFGLGMNPEFLREGEAIADFQYPDRIVIGYEDQKTKNLLEEIYSPWDCDKIAVNTRTAEMIKYSNNTLLACLISMNNELANLAFELGNINYNDVIKGVISDKRWSPIIDKTRITPTITTYFTPGAGFGGSCFPKDVQAIRAQGEYLGLSMNMTDAVLSVNDIQHYRVLHYLKKYFGKLTDKKILLLGLAFKPDTDDIRESSALKILSVLLENNCQVKAHDPISMPNTKKEFNNSNLEFIENWREEINNVDAIIIGTNWPEYKDIKDKTNVLIFDSKQLFSIDEVKNHKYATFSYNKK